MKRLALLLAAVSVLGTGCIVHNDNNPPRSVPPPCARSLTLGWQFRDYTNFVTASCGTAGVAELDVYLNDGFVGTFPCGPGGVTIDGISSGTQQVTVEGIDLNNVTGLGANRIAYRDEFAVNTTACGDHPVTTEPAEARVDLNYTVDGAPSCAGSCSVWFNILDTIAGNGTVAANYGNYANVTYPNDVILFLPVGTYAVDFLQVVTGSTPVAVKRACPPGATFEVFRPDSGAPATQVVPVSPVLMKSTCP